MDLFDRFYALHHELEGARQPVSMKTLEQRLECKRATVNRVIHDMKLYLDAPINYDRLRNGYHYQQDPAHRFEMPGLWFTPPEIRALLTLQNLLSEIQPGLLNPLLAPLRTRISKILDLERGEKKQTRKPRPNKASVLQRQLSLLDPAPEPQPSPQLSESKERRAATGELARRIRLVVQAARHADPAQLTTVSDALGRRRRLRIRYHGRERDQATERDISPQRLTHYRDNWYLEAWCHEADGLRRFSLDRILDAQPLDEAAVDIEPEKIALQTDNSYGIFSGAQTHWATLLFTAERARWIADESWHPQQRSTRLDDGRYQLEIPYSDPRELILDILRYGPEVEVLAPDELRQEIAQRLEQALARYR